jgi:hypothetical protein
MADTEPQVEHDEPPGHALSTRGYVVIALIPPLIAAIGITLLWLHYNPDQTLEGKIVPTLNSPWHPGSPSQTTPIAGTLQLDDDNCVYLVSGSTRLDPVWPAGYAVTQTNDGKITLYDTNHHIVAHSGDGIRASGEVVPVGQYAGRPCAPENGNVAVIESAVIVTSG